jgi:phosphatidylglycerol:prolipoprotein diacylglycerol transferase
MLPFVFLDEARLGPFHPFGILLAIAFGVGDSVSIARAKALGYDLKQFRAFEITVLLSAFFVSRLVDAIFYHPDLFLARPWSLLFVWEGMSSTGGLLGAVLGGFAWKLFTIRPRGILRWPVRRPVAMPLLPFAEVCCATFAIPFAIGRFGCALVHDHPGELATAGSWLAVAWPTSESDGVHHVLGPIHVVWGSTARYDLGLLESLLLGALSWVLVLTWKRRLPLGTYGILTAFVYAPARFLLDFLRMTDAPDADLRHGHLTFAQWAMLPLFLYGIVLFWYVVRRGRNASLASRVESAPTTLA